MEEQRNSRITEYLIPSNVTTRFEFFPGFGWYEFKIVVFACAIGAVIYFILGLPTKTVQINISVEQALGAIGSAVQPNEKKVSIIPILFRIFAILIPGIGSFVVVKRNPSTGMSLMALIKSANEFKKKQKRYIYKYKSGSEA
ncbi:hypothetical protein [Clostridium estertheticum]|uniref:hypothetical protein n=1 Tax=Clostridium estertheticum TaxID=238834 RepID=UPI001C0CFE52|nr:hypothetical protein [Clostridium estertheticum]MBU3173283.1 hypothetical protein [Clostridium estertheticum]